MASAFDTMVAEMGQPLLLEHHGQSVIYRRPDGTLTATITAALGPVETRRRDTDRGIVYDSVRSAAFSRDAANGGVADPQIADEIEIDGETWSVRELAHVSDSTCRAECVRKESHERGKARYVG